MKMKSKPTSGNKRRRKSSVVDLFCGAGGLTHGFILENFKVNAGIDLDPTCEFPYKANNNAEFLLKDIGSLTGKDLADLYPAGDLKILAGCAPCQPFSKYTNGRDAQEDHRWGLLYSFARLAKEVLPDVITMENVPLLSKHSVYSDFIKELEQLGYHVNPNRIYCPDYGIPQTRERLVLLASRLGPIGIIPATHASKQVPTVKDIIGHLPPINAGEASDRDPLHKSSKLSPQNLKRIKASKPGGTWDDWDPELVADCHKKDSGKTYASIYGRMEWDKPSPTITTQCFGFGNGRFGHPEQDRAISLREAALLQTFPKNYKFTPPSEPVYIKRISRLIGNAVPVGLGRVIAKSIKKHLEDFDG